MNRSTLVTFFMALLYAALLAVGFKVAGRLGFIASFVVALSAHWLIYFYSQHRLTQIFDHIELKGQDPWGLRQKLRFFAQKAEIPEPRVFVTAAKMSNAYSIDSSWQESQRGLIFVSRQLLEQLKPDEIDAVLAHEVAKLSYGSTWLMGLVSSLLAGLLVGLKAFPQFLRKFAFLLVQPLTLLLFRVCLDKDRYLSIDHKAADLLESKENLAQTLWKLQSYATFQEERVPLSAAHMFTVAPPSDPPTRQSLQMHPPIERRIENLLGRSSV